MIPLVLPSLSSNWSVLVGSKGDEISIFYSETVMCQCTSVPPLPTETTPTVTCLAV